MIEMYDTDPHPALRLDSWDVYRCVGGEYRETIATEVTWVKSVILLQEERKKPQPAGTYFLRFRSRED